jgi:hypothetical protein
MRTELEGVPKAMGQEILGQSGWTGGKHVKENRLDSQI